MTVYHVTFKRCLPSIKRVGLQPGLPPNWARRDGGPYIVGAYVYAFENFTDAVLWAAKMGWTFFQNSASPEIAILTITDELEWEDDQNDPLGRGASLGQWKCRRQAVPAASIKFIQFLTQDHIRAAVQDERQRGRPS